MKFKYSMAMILTGVFLSSMTTGCNKKVAVAAPPPAPPVQEAAPAPLKVPTASLSAEPSTIEPGQAVTLKWSSTDATEASITGLGAVAAEGTQDVRPSQSITYELAVTGPGGSAKAAATVMVIAPPPPIIAPPPPEPKSLADRIEALSDAYFDYDKSDIREDARAALARDAEALRAIFADFPDAVLVLEGHCDERGSAEYNLALGERRAATAVAYLTELGVEAGRLQTISYGNERPQCTDSTEGCWQENRRVHFAAGKRATN